jgi:transposase InsO family protein
MSRKDNYWDNACVENFFRILKRELVYHRRYATREEATQDVFKYIEVFYNRKRRHEGGGRFNSGFQVVLFSCSSRTPWAIIVSIAPPDPLLELP